MVHHIILWKIKDGINASEAALEAKKRLEALNGKIDGMISLKVTVNPLASSNCSMMLDSVFEDGRSLAGYQTNPLHLEAAGFVRSVVSERLCFDYED